MYIPKHFEGPETAGREIMLTKDETTIGRAESCDIGLFGDNAIERLQIGRASCRERV